MRVASTQACFVLLIILIAGMSSAYGQKSVVLNTNPPPAMPARDSVKTVGTAKADYQVSNDQTYANSRVVRVQLSDGGWGMISAGFSSKGKGVATPESITLRVFTASKTRQYVDDPALTVRSDSEILFDGIAEVAGARTNGRDIYATIEVKLSRPAFERLTDSKTVELTQAGTKWSLSGSDLETFKDLILLYK